MRPRRPHDFAARTMRAVVRAPLPAGRKALRDPLASMFGWAAVIAAVALCGAGDRAQPADRRGELFEAHHARRRHRRVAHAVRADGVEVAGRAGYDRSRGVASGRDGGRNGWPGADGRRGRGVAVGAAPAVDIGRRGLTMARAFITAPILVMLSVIAASAQFM